jgi:hypothetical protein
MITAPTAEDRQTARFTFALWIWTLVAAFITAEAAAKLFAHDDGALNGWAFIWGLLAGALSVLPFWAVFGVGRQVLRNTVKLRTELAAESQAEAQRVAAEAQKTAADAQMKAAAAAAVAEAAAPVGSAPVAPAAPTVTRSTTVVPPASDPEPPPVPGSQPPA